jgi:hypothetical protein
MGLFGRDPKPPENQTGPTPAAPTGKEEREKRLTDDRAILATAEQLASQGEMADAQFWRRLLGD